MFIPIIALPIILTIILLVMMFWPDDSPYYFGLVTIFRILFLVPIGFIWAAYFGLCLLFAH